MEFYLVSGIGSQFFGAKGRRLASVVWLSIPTPDRLLIVSGDSLDLTRTQLLNGPKWTDRCLAIPGKGVVFYVTDSPYPTPVTIVHSFEDLPQSPSQPISSGHVDIQCQECSLLMIESPSDEYGGVMMGMSDAWKGLSWRADGREGIEAITICLDS